MTHLCCKTQFIAETQNEHVCRLVSIHSSFARRPEINRRQRAWPPVPCTSSYAQWTHASIRWSSVNRWDLCALVIYSNHLIEQFIAFTDNALKFWEKAHLWTLGSLFLFSCLSCDVAIKNGCLVLSCCCCTDWRRRLGSLISIISSTLSVLPSFVWIITW